jgi:hypothetical protein
VSFLTKYWSLIIAILGVLATNHFTYVQALVSAHPIATVASGLSLATVMHWVSPPGSFVFLPTAKTNVTVTASVPKV